MHIKTASQSLLILWGSSVHIKTASQTLVLLVRSSVHIKTASQTLVFFNNSGFRIGKWARFLVFDDMIYHRNFLCENEKHKFFDHFFMKMFFDILDFHKNISDGISYHQKTGIRPISRF